MADPRPGWWAAAAAVARREAAFLRASPWDLAMLSAIPLLVCALVAWIFSAGVVRELGPLGDKRGVRMQLPDPLPPLPVPLKFSG